MPLSMEEVEDFAVSEKQTVMKQTVSDAAVLLELHDAKPKLEWYDDAELGKMMGVKTKTARERMTQFITEHTRKITYKDGNIRFVPFPIILARRVTKQGDQNVYIFAFINKDTKQTYKHIEDKQWVAAYDILNKALSSKPATVKELEAEGLLDEAEEQAEIDAEVEAEAVAEAEASNPNNKKPTKGSRRR